MSSSTDTKRKRPAPFPVRFSAEEWAQLEAKAGDMPLGAYIRAKALGKQTAAKTDYVMLGRILGLLGKSELASSLCLLAVAAEQGALMVDDDVAADLKSACADVQEIRLILIKALGLHS
ncbi:plasmid mobilization protein [Hwanghaeella sp. LZ110]|uniref:plasmid mobilization protein n=1 Tax=Hwanghaeella sp. LZ110 TaxID=3402810 RepID=UPI003B66D44D